MSTPRRFRHSRIAALAFAGVFVVCAVVIGVVFSMNKSDTPSPEAATPSDRHLALTLQNFHAQIGGATTTNTWGTATNVAITVGQMHISAPTTTIQPFARSFPGNVEFQGGSLIRTVRTVTFPAGINSFGQVLSPHSWNATVFANHGGGAAVSGVTGVAGTSVAGSSYSINSRTNSITITQAMFVDGQVRGWTCNDEGTSCGWLAWGSVNNVGFGGDATSGWNPGGGFGASAWVGDGWRHLHGSINTSPIPATTTTMENPHVAPFAGSHTLWQTNNRVPMAGSANASTFAAQSAFPAWITTRVTGQSTTHVNLQVSLTAAAPFGMYLKGVIPMGATTADFAVAHTSVNQRVRTIDYQITQAHWRNNGPNRTHVFVGMYYNAADNTVPTRAVTFNLQGGNFSGNGANHIVNIPNGGQLNAPSPNPTREHYTFRHWSTTSAGNGFTFPVIINSNNAFGTGTNTLFAVWGRNPVITFNTHGGSTVPQETINWGERITRPADPTRFGYHFSHWSNVQDGVTHWNFNNTVTANTTLHAVFTDANWMTLELRIGNPLNDTSMTMTMTKPENTVVQLRHFIPSHIDLDFLGWALSAEQARNKQIFRNPTQTIAMTDNWTFYAVWDIEWNNFPGIGGHNILSFNFSGGLNPHSSIVEERQYFAWDPMSRTLPTHEYMDSFAMRNPDFHGLTFIGWYNNPDFLGQRYFLIPDTSSGPMNFYARWVEL
ncbi:MAG: InlB B-repeat-containing protein [Firmicutes bacterium]|nr:InlB B-repeat-containing protein [Bacillota bacterium]